MGKFIKYISAVLIALMVALVGWTIASTPEDPTIANATAVGADLTWGYIVLAVAVALAIFSAGWDLVQKPEGIKGALLSLVAIVAIVVVCYVLAGGHDYQIIDLNTQDFFERGETVITDACIMVTYVAFAAAIVAAIYSAVTDALK